MKASESLQNDQSTATENALRLAVDTTPAFIHTARPNGYFDCFNRGWLDFLGKSLEEVCGWRWTESVHPEDVAALVQKWHAALASGEPFVAEARVRCGDGTLNRVRGWKQLAIDVARQATRANPEINFRNGGIASPFPSNSFRSAWEAARAQCLGHLEISFGICSNRSHQHLAGGTRALQSHQNQKQTL
jgi:PAS domain S-box-containing protein